MGSDLSESLPLEAAAGLDELFRTDPHATHLGARLVDWSLGSAIVECTVAEHHLNFLGVGHGGVVFSVADIAMSVASNSPGRTAVAIHLDINYLHRVDPGDRIVATASVASMSRRFCHVSLSVARGERQLATATGITYRTDDWHLGADTWPDEWRARF